ncbi:hypothetical protein [Aeromonas phage Asp37]|nr:hypothetical protein [Aeromonas phage Asp37]
MSYIKACVITCKRPLFQRYLMERAGRLVTNEEEALKVVRLLTGIRSRKELTRCPNAAMEWQNLITDFNKWNAKQ